MQCRSCDVPQEWQVLHLHLITVPPEGGCSCRLKVQGRVTVAGLPHRRPPWLIQVVA